jgi:NTE family protein
MLMLALLGGSCAQHQGPRPLVFDPAVRRTCVVLSVGGPSGVAHIGAINALKEDRVPIHCVVGNSVGALIGGLYASAPDANLDDRFRQFVGAYVAETQADAERNGVMLGALFGGLAAIFAGGLVAPLVAATVGVGAGEAGTEQMQHDRMVRVLDGFLHEARIEELPVPFVTFFQVATATGVVRQTADRGRLAGAVGASIANPLIFPSLAIGPGRPLDPGSDRMSATPVQDACRLFPDANMLAINVTGQPVELGADMKCPLLEVRIVAEPVSVADTLALGDTYARVVERGRASTHAALHR